MRCPHTAAGKRARAVLARSWSGPAGDAGGGDTGAAGKRKRKSKANLKSRGTINSGNERDTRQRTEAKQEAGRGE